MLEGERYLSLATFRRDGRAVSTPIWFAADKEGALYAFSAGDAGKVKRLRNSPRARVAACDARGRVHGEWCEARGYLVADAAQRARADELLHGKYGWLMWLADAGSRLTGRHAKRMYLRIEPAP
jgi:PPOX class probable F420-dependent enzyme